jgi:hypothetical protein
MLGATLIAAATMTVLSGCVSGATGETQVSTPSPAPSAATTPEPAPDATPAAATCDTVLTADGYAKVDSLGLTPMETSYFEPLAARMHDAGATTCSWGKPQTDTGLTVVQLPVSETDWPTWMGELAAAGYVESNDPVEGTHTGPVDPGTGVPSLVVVDDDRITYLNTATLAGMLTSAS